MERPLADGERVLQAARQFGSPVADTVGPIPYVQRQRLIDDPRDIEAKVDFVTLYHMIIEGTLALTGQWLLTDYMERKEILPGWVPLAPRTKPITLRTRPHLPFRWIRRACATTTMACWAGR